jgi:hypothetical protein
VQVLEALELDRVVQGGVDPVVGLPVLGAAHVRREALALAPAADHDQLAGLLVGVAVGLPHLEVHEPVGLVHQVRPAAEGGHQIGGALPRHTQSRHRDVHGGEFKPARRI